MGNVMIIVILAAIVLIALRSSSKHMKGEGGCCNGGSVPKPEKKKLKGVKIAEKILTIEGMHCENCKNSVERQLNDIRGVVAKVSLKKKIAVVSMDQIVDDRELTQAVERAGFQVVKIETGNV